MRKSGWSHSSTSNRSRRRRRKKCWDLLMLKPKSQKSMRIFLIGGRKSNESTRFPQLAVKLSDPFGQREQRKLSLSLRVQFAALCVVQTRARGLGHHCPGKFRHVLGL